ncbi:MAG: hypothetical protein AB7F96_09290 [Beijerinckiaceae bacterium]
MLPEPFRTQAIARGLVGELMPVAVIRDNMNVGAITCSDKFANQRRPVAQKLMA